MAENMNKSEYLVEVNDLKQYFPVKTGFFSSTPLKAVDGVSFNIKPGETLGLVGESGCGKTTVGRSLLRLYQPTGGEFKFDGELVTDKNIHALRKEMQIELRRIQQELELTFVYVTHDQEEALTMSDSIVVMKDGIIQQIGSPTDIYNEPVNSFVADFIGESNIVNGCMPEDCVVEFAGRRFECVDRGFNPNETVDVVIRPEDVIITPPEHGQLTGVVEKVTFKGVHYEMSIRCGKCEILVHSTRSAEIGSTVGMTVVPFNIQIMNKLLPFYDNIIETTVTSSDEEEKYFEFELEGETVKAENHFFPEGTRLKITLPPEALSLAGDGDGDLQDVFIESVIYKGEHNEIILESDERKWLMLSDTDEQVATYVPLNFDFSKAEFEVLDPEPVGKEG